MKSKKFNSVNSIILLILILTVSCDTIPENDRFVDTPPTVAKKRVLFEEYTGMRCQNCPAAAVIAEALKNTYGENLIQVNVHTGNNARPVGSIFREDFRTEAGNTYSDDVADFGGGLNDHPKAMIDRSVEYESSKALSRDRWTSAVQQQLEQTAPYEIRLSTEWNEDTKTVKITVKVDAIEDFSEKAALQLWITEDGIVAPQLDGSNTVEDYVHRHVLRAAINGTWGEELQTIPQGKSFTYEKSFQIPERFSSGQIQPTKPENCAVVAFIYRKSNKSVIQVNEIKVIN